MNKPLNHFFIEFQSDLTAPYHPPPDFMDTPSLYGVSWTLKRRIVTELFLLFCWKKYPSKYLMIYSATASRKPSFKTVSFDIQNV